MKDSGRKEARDDRKAWQEGQRKEGGKEGKKKATRKGRAEERRKGGRKGGRGTERGQGTKNGSRCPRASRSLSRAPGVVDGRAQRSRGWQRSHATTAPLVLSSRGG